jgi:hypothetical protein
MHPLTYSTIIAEIRDVLSDSDGYEPPHFTFCVNPNSQRRSLKPTLRTFTQVSKQWRYSTLARPSCWVTKVYISGLGEEKFKQSMSRAKEKLDEAQDSDIDFRAAVPYPQNFSSQAFQDFVGWMERNIFSASYRVRKNTG